LEQLQRGRGPPIAAVILTAELVYSPNAALWSHGEVFAAAFVNELLSRHFVQNASLSVPMTTSSCFAELPLSLGGILADYAVDSVATAIQQQGSLMFQFCF
jgi:hypothetical protein